ncbi:MAG: hypothetical protein AAGF47_10860 [Planctomycetota bacterium]
MTTFAERSHPGVHLDAALELLLQTVGDPWDSMEQSLRDIPPGGLGAARTEASAAWHLWHACSVFRYHATLVIGDSRAAEWPPSPTQDASAEEVQAALKADVHRFVAWARANAETFAAMTIPHGQDRSPIEMLGVMSRHIVWHAAAVYYRARPRPANA